MRRCAGLLLLASLLLLSSHGRAQSAEEAARAAARKLGYAGIEAYQAADYASAADKLDRAYQVLKAPSLGLWSARSMLATGRLVDASERLVEVTRLSVESGERKVQEKAKVDARRELDALIPRIPSVVIRLEGAEPSDVTLSIDGVGVPSALVGEGRPTDPGKHRVEGVRGTERVQAEVTLKEREDKSVTLRFNPARALPAAGGAAPAGTAVNGSSPSASNEPGADRDGGRARASSSGGSGLRTFGWISIGVGAAGAGVAITTGVLALQKKRDIQAAGDCVGGCKETGRVQNFNTLRTISIASSIAAGVLVVTGVTLVLVAPSGSDTEAALSVGPGSVSIRGAF